MARFIFALLLLFVGAIASTSALGQEDSGAEDRYEQLAKIMENTSNQFTYAFFGKGMLLYFLEDATAINIVSEASDEELSRLSKPFNAVLGKLFIVGLTGIYALTVLYFLAKLGWFAVNEIWNLQAKGESRMSGKERKGFILKLTILGALVVMPVPLKTTLLDDKFYTNALTASFFHLLGETTRMSDESTEELVKSQRQTLTVLPLPASDAKQDSAMAMNVFFTCLRTQEYREQDDEYLESIKLFEQPGSGRQMVRGRVQIGECGLDIKLGIDRSTDNDMQALNLSSDSFDFESDMFAKAQIDILSRVISEQLERAKRFSSELAKEDTHRNMNEGSPTLLEYTSLERDNIELSRWTEDCAVIERWTSGSDSILIKDRVLFNHLSARCSSSLLTNALVYPDTYSVLDEYLSSPGSQRKQIAMCVDQAQANDIMNSVYVANYKLSNVFSSSPNIESIALEACVMDMCSDANLQDGGLYACANAVDLYSARYRDYRVADRGSMMLGFYMFNLFLHHPPSSTAKQIFNQLQFTFFDEEEGTIHEDGEPLITVSFNVPAATGDVQERGSILSDVTESLENLGIPTISPAPDFGDTAQIIGFSRLLTCIQSPLQIKNGYVCNNVPQEFSRFGLELLKGAVAFKTALLMGDTISRSGRFYKLTGVNSGSVEDAASTAMKSAVKNAGSLLLPAAGAATAGSLMQLADGIGFSVTDEFGNLNSSMWAELSAAIGVDVIFALGMLGTDSPLMSFVDSALLIALIAGVVFGVILPLFPMLLILSALAKFLYLIIKTLILHGFKMTDIIFESDTGILTEQMDMLWADWLAALLKLPLTVIGAVLAWLMSNVIISKVMSGMSFSFEVNDGATHGLIDTIVVIGVSLIVIIIIYNMVLTIIESFYDFTVEWLLGQMTNSPFGDQRAVGWKDAKGVLSMMGR
ncbi:hypothetical protein BM525_21540 (plasmid) [Alteromonas mediterranea]|uniref:Uncharacterized protein n=1 Tax=Alteromonas mediterranea TaxID=314275 RepID=A0AAC9NT25_9ALTE|nr:hypothetical protein [Alteromonas mediterranea]APD92445.1 hypothetical protein BM524_21320 [Alteromonas mediterranea]APE00306.1 hypothetical protein BM525_21540 [Alteromonas mediterranea]